MKAALPAAGPVGFPNMEEAPVESALDTTRCVAMPKPIRLQAARVFLAPRVRGCLVGVAVML